MPEPNLVKYLPRLSIKEKAVLLRLIREVPGEEHHFEGTLPFVSLSKVLSVLKLVAVSVDAYGRIARGMLAKLNDDDCQGNAVFLMRLNNKKVHRQFGAHPERGKPLNFLPKEKVTVGVKYSLPKKDYVPDTNVLVAPSVVLKKRGELWEVTVVERCRQTVQLWLQTNCA